MNNLQTFFEDNNGGFSMMRLVFLLWGAGVLLIWMYTCYMTGGLVSIPAEVVTVLLGLGTAKAVQRGLETSSTSSTTTTTTVTTPTPTGTIDVK